MALHDPKQIRREMAIRSALSLSPELIITWDTVKIHTDKGCKKCYGRGYIGKRQNGTYIICKCLRVIT